MPPQWGNHTQVYLPANLPEHDYLKVRYCGAVLHLLRNSGPVSRPAQQHSVHAPGLRLAA